MVYRRLCWGCLQDFLHTGVFADKAAAYQAAADLLTQSGPAGLVTFHGQYGTGKTHMLQGVVNGFRLKETLSVYRTMADLLADIRRRFGETSGIDAEAVIDHYRHVKVLCIDEVDKVHLTSWAQETMFRFLDSRYQERDRLLTVLAMNTRLEDLPSEPGYLHSRMEGGRIVEVGGVDMRPGGV